MSVKSRYISIRFGQIQSARIKIRPINTVSEIEFGKFVIVVMSVPNVSTAVIVWQ